MVDPSGHWGRRASGSYVHQELTREAIRKYDNDGLRFRQIHDCSMMQNIIMDGVILPDYLQSKHKKSYGQQYIHTYKKYLNKKLCGITLYVKGKKGERIKDKLHGKSKNKMLKFRDTVLKKIKKYGLCKKTYLLIGCYLHSVQDYSAHSYCAAVKNVDLAKYKATSKTERKKYSDAVNGFHKDWEDKDNQEKLHKEFKDNPSAVFDKNIRTGKYQWRMLFDSKEKNPRCEKAINDSIVFLRKAFSYMQ